MASYIEANLGRGEQIIYRAQVSWLSQIWYFIIGIILLPVMFAGVIFFIFAAINVMSTELALTNKRVIAKFGFIRRQTIELNLNKVESIVVNQGVIGRMFNFGSVGVRGTGGGQAPIPYIARPQEFRQQVNNLLDEEQAKLLE
ncbi:hypothetical protein A7Q01_04715 [Eikenella sp. NML96-A-049]|uniref:PH domain-containing protein n=2 Tax=unclassified Eikenella TaxID=2639367 RepID=UPI0007DF8950|nr:PH domain-containing protein [Eikenella sp. NML070372]OAM34036.1 hypothetical protein A7P97_02065 [Eikenella sp. NML070372]OAM38781.1 hypothetical protein A7Q01_04715 [Eikenella sp. NML96-A-049]